MQYSAGDVLEIKFPEFKHYGLYTDTDSVIHNSKKAGKVEETTIDGFAEGRDIAVSAEIKAANRMLAVQTARKYINLPYDLFSENCEHFARMVCGMTKESKQVQKYLITALGVGVLLESDSDVLKIAGGVAAAAALATSEGSPVKNAAVAGCLAAGIAFLLKK